MRISRRRSALYLIPCVSALVFTECAPPTPLVRPVLLFSGTGTSPNDVAAVEALLKKRGLGFTSVSSSRLNELSLQELRAYRLLIVPGGDFVAMGKSLTPNSAATIRSAVRGGLHYFGICAGGLLAGDVRDNGLNLTDGVRFDFYALVHQGIHKAVVEVSPIGAPPMEHYWEDGPQYAGWGTVVATYPNGTPAVVEGLSGKGWVLLTGTHPEAPETWWRGLPFRTHAKEANAFAESLVDAALSGSSLLPAKP